MLSKKATYVIDFLNLFSDYREIKYKKLNIDFHKIKDQTLVEDCRQFFSLFFSKYITYLTLTKNSHYVFITKKIKKLEDIIPIILDTYKSFSMEFLVIETKFSDPVFDKQKDDMLCQYLCRSATHRDSAASPAIYLLSNDKYRPVDNTQIVIPKSITVIQYSNYQRPVKQTISLSNNLDPDTAIRKYGISKRKLDKIIY